MHPLLQEVSRKGKDVSLEEVACLWLNHYTRVTFQVIEYTSTVYTLAAPGSITTPGSECTQYTCTPGLHSRSQCMYTCTSGSPSRSQCTRVHQGHLSGHSVHVYTLVGTNFRGHSVHMYQYSNGMYCTVYSVHSPQLSAITLCPCDVFVRALSFIMQECASVCNARKGAFYNIMPCLLHSIIQYKKMHLGQASYIMPELWLYIYTKYIQSTTEEQNSVHSCAV